MRRLRSGQTRVRLDGGAREGALRRERASHPPQLFGGCSRAHPAVLARAIQPVPNPLTHLGGPLVSWRERRQRRALADRAHVEHGARAGRPVQPWLWRFLRGQKFRDSLVSQAQDLAESELQTAFLSAPTAACRPLGSWTSRKAASSVGAKFEFGAMWIVRMTRYGHVGPAI